MIDLGQPNNGTAPENDAHVLAAMTATGVFMRRRTILCFAALVLSVAATPAQAAEQRAEQALAPVKREIIPGSELMTSQERERYRQRIRAAKGLNEEEKVRSDHTAQMRERARVRGLQLREPEPQKQSGSKP